MSSTILIIDDDDMIRDVVKLYLEHAGYKVIQASNGPEGIEKYKTEKPDLIVMDVAMPEMSGFEAAKTIRTIQKNEERSRIPIVLLTAYARSFFTSAGIDTGIDSYLTKPITPDQLLNCIKRFLGAPAG